MGITAEQVKELRTKTGAGMMDCKKALQETSGDFDEAVKYLRKKGMASASKKAGRATSEGAVHSYIHGDGKVGVLVEVNCETDFVARTEQFKTFVKDIAMHIAAASPQWVQPDEVPQDILDREREIILAQMKDSNKPENVVNQIVDGKLKKFYSENCLLEQAYVKDTDKKIQAYLQETIGALGENMSIRRFCRFALGE